jgi:glycosyltransferase involved in cell wall biosynthesis
MRHQQRSHADDPQPAVIPASDIEVVMLTYNEFDMLPYSLPPLMKHFENFLFLDMESDDRTCEFIRQELGARARIVSYRRNQLLDFGYAHARNFAAAHGQKPWLFAIDADEVLVDGVAVNGVPIDSQADAVSIVALERRNVEGQGWKLGQPFDPALFTGRVVKKDRLYRPSSKAYWEGYIHEELIKRPEKTAPKAGSSIRLEHLTNFRSRERERFKRQMYSWMLLRVYRQEVPRRGVNQFWFNEYVPNRLAQIEADAQAFANKDNFAAQPPA